MFHFLVVIIVIIGGLWLWDYVFPPPGPNVLPQNLPAGRFTPAELEYYRQVFDYTMTMNQTGDAYEWKSQNGSGVITPGDVFFSKSGSNCRPFSESYTAGNVHESAEGVACKREGKEGWCRLKKTDALTCAMEPPLGATDKAARGTQDALGAARDVLGKAQGLLR